MKQTTPARQKALGSEDSYTPDFFKELYEKVGAKSDRTRHELKLYILLAAQKYLTLYSTNQIQSPSHEVEKELGKALLHIDKAAESLVRVYAHGGDCGVTVIGNLCAAIAEKYPLLKSITPELHRQHQGGNATITSPVQSLDLLASLADAIERTLKNYESPKTTVKSRALYDWLMIVSAKLEPILKRKLEQSHYYKAGKQGAYVSKKPLSDSELLLFIIAPLDPNVTIAQLETAIKETRTERIDAPWTDYFPV